MEKFFREYIPNHEYKSAGVNQYHTSRKKTTYLSFDLIKWADIIICAEEVHRHIMYRNFPSLIAYSGKQIFVLDAGEYKADEMEEYIAKAVEKLGKLFNA